MNKRFYKTAIISFIICILMIPTMVFATETKEPINAQKSNNTGTTYITGDVDGNGTININDVTEFQLILVGLKDETDYYVKNGETLTDGKKNIRDATVIQMYICGKYIKLPITTDGWYAPIFRP